MALADRLKDPRPNPAGLPCSVRVLLDTLQGDDLAAFQHMLGSREWSQDMIWQALADEGHRIGRQSVNRHRGGKCRCAKVA